MIKRLLNWLFSARKPATYSRETPFLLAKGVPDEQVKEEILNHVINTGETVFATRQEDGSVLVHGAVSPTQNESRLLQCFHCGKRYPENDDDGSGMCAHCQFN